jgi:hypothetical protein
MTGRNLVKKEGTQFQLAILCQMCYDVPATKQTSVQGVRYSEAGARSLSKLIALPAWRRVPFKDAAAMNAAR